MTRANLDQPDNLLGRQDPFVHALRIWTSLEALRGRSSEDHLGEIARSMDVVLIRLRHTLVTQYLVVAPSSPEHSSTLRRELGLEYWGDGELLAQNDPERRTT